MPSDKLSYSEDPAWADVTPIPQNDPDKALAPIHYHQEYKEAMDYFRAVVKANEHSERVLTLTLDIIRMNPAHYTAWQYRYQTLLHLNSPLDEELAVMNKMLGSNLKSYQIWHHRRLLQAHIRDPYTELNFISKVLRPSPSSKEFDMDEDEDSNTRLNELGGPVDTKNYHTWAYRQWLLAEFNSPELWAGELEFVDEMLQDDIRNNSAWHHRFFVVWENGVREGEIDREGVLRREIDFCKESIALVPNSASSWNYLRGVLQTSSTPFATLETFVTPFTLPQPSSGQAMDTDTPSSTIDLENPAPSPTAQLPCALAIEFLADVYLEKAADAESKEVAETHIQKAFELFGSLASKHDTIRRKYWAYRQHRARHQA